MLELTRNGWHEEACRLAGLRDFPSWGLMIENDATTIWERWDGYVKGRGFQDAGMNSFNHWALGAVGEWVWRTVAGISPDETHPGFRHFVIRPRPGGDVTWARGEYLSIRGRIASEWKREGGRFVLNVTIPPNTTATVYVPADDAGGVRESGRPAAQTEGVRFLRMDGGAAVYEIESGSYRLESAVPERRDEGR
jgi:alpha-L-rhamnosidase